MRAYTLVLSFMILGLLSGKGSATENDLSIFKSVVLEGIVYSAFNHQTGRFDVYVEIPHPYSNTLACQGRAPYWVEKRGRQYEERIARFHSLGIFPEKAFNMRLSYPLVTSLGTLEKIAPFDDQTIEVLCHGWNPETPLPPSLCEDSAMNPAHAKACASLARGGSYPFMMHNQYLGACACRD